MFENAHPLQWPLNLIVTSSAVDIDQFAVAAVLGKDRTNIGRDNVRGCGLFSAAWSAAPVVLGA